MSQSTTDAGERQDEMQEDDAQRWPTPSDCSVPCTQSHASDSQTSKDYDLLASELRLEQMGYQRPFPVPVPISFESVFPLPDGCMDSRAVQGERARLEAAKDDSWEAVGEQRGRGRSISRLTDDARHATAVYVTYLEHIRSGAIRPVDGPSFRQEGNKLAAMRMYLLEALADEAVKKRTSFI